MGKYLNITTYLEEKKVKLDTFTNILKDHTYLLKNRQPSINQQPRTAGSALVEF